MEKFVSVIVKLFITREKFYKISRLGGKKGWRKRREREALFQDLSFVFAP